MYIRNLFLLDGIGALLSAFLLGVVLAHFENIFGMPRNTLYFLSFFPALFAVYDFYCYFRIKNNWKPYLKGIAIANLIYCLLSMVLLFHHYQQLSALGLSYFILELIVIIIIVGIEFKAV